MNGVNRLPEGGSIDRNKVIEFTFNGRTYSGFNGDTVASALLASDVKLVGRSFKYHRPRGIVSSGYEEPGGVVQLLGDQASGNLQATMVNLRQGLQVRSVNCWPSPAFDLGGINQILAPFIPAAFYYKTFFWPSWKLYEPFIRRAAGLAAAPATAPADGSFEVRNHHCDVLVVGAGAAGLAAARCAAQSGLRVLIADRDTMPGGRLLDCPAEIDGLHGADWASEIASDLRDAGNVRFLQNTMVWACREHNLVLASEKLQDGRLERNWRIRTNRLILATGAIERMLVFAGNDRPGVMLASAVNSYINRFAVRPGNRAVVFANNDSVYETVSALRRAKIDIAAVVDIRQHPPLLPEYRAAGIRMIAGAEITRVLGRKSVRGVEIRKRKGLQTENLKCDLLVVSGGWNPALQLWSQARKPIAFDHVTASFVPDGTRMEAACVVSSDDGRICCAGAAAGGFELSTVIHGGNQAGEKILSELHAANSVEGSAGIPSQTYTYECSPSPAYGVQSWWHSDTPVKPGKSFVDVMNDVTLSDIHLAVREGYRSVEHVKRYTTAGMGIDQGRTGNINVIGAIARITGKSMEEVGVTTFRSPLAPVSFGSIQGIREDSVILPFKHTPVTKWNIAQDAVMYEAGARWRRPGYFPRPGESMLDAVNREAMAVRTGVAVYDGSPLGTFAIKGRDAGRLLDMIYTGVFSDLPEGQGRYGIMLTDAGVILDDGVSFRISPHEYLMSTSTGNTSLVYQHIRKFLAVERPEWQVQITDLTCQWMNATICGPKARDLVQELGTEIDISNEAFPFMGIREGVVAGFKSRVARVSFTGELSFEINVRARDLRPLWEKIIEVGSDFGIQPIGSETNHVLRVEKGFLSLGHEVDGTADPIDLGLGWAMSKKKEYLGRHSVFLRRMSGRPRRELVGLATKDSQRVAPEGAPLTPGGRREPSEGFVTASVWSECCGRSVSLALLMDGKARHGETVHIRLPNEIIEATVTGFCAYDPSGEKLRS